MLYLFTLFQSFNNLYAWANCKGGWYTLPSGMVICYIEQSLPLQNRTDLCDYLGGYILELHTMEDYLSLVFYIWKLIANYAKNIPTLIAMGAATESLTNNTENLLLWQSSKKLVDYSQHGIIRPLWNQSTAVQQDQILFLLPLNYSNTFSPSFTLLGMLTNDTASEFICMKPGTVDYTI